MGDLDTGEHKSYAGEPETFLASIVEFLQDCGQTLADIHEVHIMKGGGSSTALRTTIAQANVWRFVTKGKLYEYEGEIPFEDLWPQILSGQVIGKPAENYVQPLYTHAPRITPTNKDQLNRKLK